MKTHMPKHATSATKAPPAAQSTPSRPACRWSVVGMLWLVCFFNYADRQAIYSVFPLLSREFDFDKVQLGLIGSACMWVYAGGATFAGFAAEPYVWRTGFFLFGIAGLVVALELCLALREPKRDAADPGPSSIQSHGHTADVWAGAFRYSLGDAILLSRKPSIA